MNSRIILVLFILISLSLAQGESDSPATIGSISTDNWSIILLATEKFNTGSPDLSSKIQNAAIAAGKAAADAKNKSQSELATQDVLVSMLLYWYSSELHTKFQNENEKQQWQIQRLALAQMVKSARKSYGSVVDDSWKHLMSTCRVLGYPQASLPTE